MASIVLRDFGGMAPSANPKSLPEAAATYVQNLDLRFGDFRPLASPQSLGAASAGATLYKMEGNNTFITRPGVVNFVRGPIPNDPTERTYYSGDGAPKVIDLNGEVRQLGVPAPAIAPVAALVAGPQFSEDDARAMRIAKYGEVLDAVRNNLGNTISGLKNELFDMEPGFVGRFITTGDYPYEAHLRVPGSLSPSGAFIPTNPAHANLNDWRIGFEYGATPGTFYVTLIVRARSTVVMPGMQAALQAIKRHDGTDPLLSPELLATVMSTINNGMLEADIATGQSNTRMVALIKNFIQVADAGDAGNSASRGEVEAFYARPEINKIVEAAITRAVSATYAAMNGYAGTNGSTLPVTGIP